MIFYFKLLSLLFVCFSTGKEGEFLIEDVIRLRNNTVDELWDVTCCKINVFSEASWRNHVSTQLIEYQRTFVDAVRNGYDPKHTDSWSFSGAFLYSLTVITTIGKYLFDLILFS